ncbi:alpha/beta fold hydrolase [Tsukamurella asaccharolytica]|uniref:Alpha/beta fold hydrolase n=1 Tax=Tsukamurella asaccharolytica TaxID=2592067 RepID=A0A5C5REG8_9ACTN|nr:alpha/beta fold hydrolase [Tsukamurella asaccharolytica]TWS21367.1 alpha/beta fold hydrolase [Tsukamurella asaccharolytica]
MTHADGVAGDDGPFHVDHVDLMCYRVRYAIKRGDPDRTPMVMCNGLGARMELLMPLAERLDGIETILFDVPGAGLSPSPRHPYTMAMAAGLTACMLAELGYSKYDVFGFSWGGMLAQQLAFQEPNRCRRLVLAATMPGTPMVPARLSTLLRVATPRRLYDAEYARRIQGDLYGGGARVAKDDPLETVRSDVSHIGYLFQQLALLGWSSLPLMPLLRQPTLILAGDDDPIVPLVNARIMAALIPRGRLHVMHDGHYFLRSSADETVSVITDFLDEGARPAPHRRTGRRG